VSFSTRAGLGFGLALMTFSAVVWAEEPDARFTGDWDGRRTKMEEQGVAIFANYTVDGLRNWNGGYAQGNSFQGIAEAGVILDLEKVWGWAGTSLYLSGMRVHGDDPSAELVGDYNYVSNIVAENTTRVFQAWAAWQREEFSIKAGLLTFDDAFMVSETSQLFINSGFGPMPTISGNTSTPIWPISALGAAVSWIDEQGWSLQAGVFDGDGGDELSNRRGTTIRLDADEGALTVIEAGKIFSPTSYPTSVKAGFWFHSGYFQDYASGEERHGNQGFFAIVDQHLTRVDDSGPTWVMFARAGNALSEARNVVRFHGDIGVSATGLIAGRPDDVFGFGICRTEFGSDYLAAREAEESFVTRRETVLEATYSIALGHGVTLQPDLQYVFDPHESGRDAFLGILRVYAEF
jgi:porin